MLEPAEKTDKSGTGISKWIDYLKGGKGGKIIVAVGLLGMALILASEFWPKKTADTGAARATAEEFVQKTETKLETLIGSIEGAGQCQVMVTLENGVEYVYATQQKVNTDQVEDKGGDKTSQKNNTEENIIIVDTDNGRQGLLVTEIQPTVKGVVIICEGGDQPIVQERVIKAVTTALNISSKRVCVTKRT